MWICLCISTYTHIFTGTAHERTTRRERSLWGNVVGASLAPGGELYYLYNKIWILKTSVRISGGRNYAIRLCAPVWVQYSCVRTHTRSNCVIVVVVVVAVLIHESRGHAYRPAVFYVFFMLHFCVRQSAYPATKPERKPGGVGLTGAEIGEASGKQHEHHQCCCGRKYKSSAHKRGAHTHTRTHWRAHARIHSLVRSL